ncbi:hypothetical protein ACQ4PT_067758 [Festuca glaucescens]
MDPPGLPPHPRPHLLQPVLRGRRLRTAASSCTRAGTSMPSRGTLSLYLQVLTQKPHPRPPPPPPPPHPPNGIASSATASLSSTPPITAKSLARDSWHRFSSKKRSHGWSDFAPSATASYLLPPHDSLVIAADISVLSETASFTEADGRFTWMVSNFAIFREMIRTQKITSSPFFPAAAAAGGSDSGLRISVYQSNVSGADHLSVCLEGKEPVAQATTVSSASALASTSAGSGVPDTVAAGVFSVFQSSTRILGGTTSIRIHMGGLRQTVPALGGGIT